MNEMVFSAEEFRQFIYCPRILFFRHVAKIIPDQTYKMKQGSNYHDEKIRRNTQSRVGNTSITYNVFLENKELGICALFDAIAQEKGMQYYPIEFKTGKTHLIIPEHHFAQLLAQAVLIEQQYKTTVSQVEIRYSDERRYSIPITEQDKKSLLEQLKCMREMISEEILPSPTKIRAKCHDCEFWIACRRA